MSIEFSKFKFVFRKNSGGEFTYNAINEIGLYASKDATGQNLLFGGIATSNGNYNAQIPEYAIDGNPDTYWESSSRTEGSPAELRIDLDQPVSVRSLKIISIPYTNERPNDFSVYGSNDGISWVLIRNFKDFFSGLNSITERSCPIALTVSGNSKLANGEPSLHVFIHNWDSGMLIGKAIPSEDGYWIFRDFDELYSVLVTHIGPNGFKPDVDGPITPYWE